MGWSVGGGYSNFQGFRHVPSGMTFINPTNLGTYEVLEPVSIAFAAVSSDNQINSSDTISTFALVGGTLPTGLSFSSSGHLTGTMPDDPNGTKYTFKIQVNSQFVESPGPFGETVILTGTATFTMTATTITHDLLLELPLDGSFTPTTGSIITANTRLMSAGTYTTAGQFASYEYEANAHVIPGGHTYLLPGTITPNEGLPTTTRTRVNIGSLMSFANQGSDFTIEFFMGVAKSSYNAYEWFDINGHFTIDGSAYSYTGIDPTYMGEWSINFGNVLDGTTGNIVKFYPVPTDMHAQPRTTGLGIIPSYYGSTGWMHVAYVAHNGTIAVYLNGSNGGYTPHSYSGSLFNIANPYIYFCSDKFAHLRIYNYAKYTTNNFSSPTDLVGLF